MIQRSRDFEREISRRRTIRSFSPDPIPEDVLNNAILAAGSSPSGANLQPWHFSVVTDESVRHEIRKKSEIQEEAFYSHRAPEKWLKALEPMGTTSDKHFLDSAPCHIVVFSKKHILDKGGNKQVTYYPIESVGLATGILITALHFSGICTLTYTPSPMGFLNKILNRPESEKPYMIVVCGFPEKDTTVPDIKRKSLSEISNFI